MNLKLFFFGFLSLLVLSLSFVSSQSAPTSYFAFDESSGRNATDFARFYYNMTVNSSWTTTGKINNSIEINNTYTFISNTNITQNSSALTYNFWFNQTNRSTQGLVIQGGTFSANGGFRLVNPNGANGTGANLNTFLMLDFSDSATRYLPILPLNITVGKFYMISLILNNSAIKVYVDGALNVTYSANNFNMRNQNATILLFKDSNPAGNYKFDELGVWKRELSQSEITNLYNGGAGLSYFDFGDPPLSLSVNLDSPSDDATSLGSTTFSSTSTIAGGDYTNATLYLWNPNGTLLSRTTNTVIGNLSNTTSWTPTGFNIGTYQWNARWCGINASSTNCAFATSNFTINFGNFTEEYEPTLIEGQSTGINLNITFDGINTNVLSLLTWNNTVITPTKSIINSSRVRFSSTFVVPIGTGNTSGVNITHFWRFYLPDGSLNDTTANAYQQVFSLGMDNCTVFSDLLLNYTLYDEDTATILNGTSQNGTIEVEVLATSLADADQQSNFSRTYSRTNNARVCISEIASGYRIDTQVRYTAADYVVEFHNIQNSTLSATNFPQHIGLYPLLTTRSQEFLVTFKDSSFVPVPDALITLSRKYVGEGLFRTVEAPETNTDGQALLHMVLGDIIYTIIVSKDGRLLGTFDNIVPFCNNIATGECTINLNAFSSGTSPQDFETINNVSISWQFNRTARTITSIFSNLDGSNSLFNLTGTLFDNRGNNTVCSSTVQTSSGSLICTVPVSIGNSTIRATLYKDGAFISTRLFSLTDSSDTGFGYTGVIMLALMYITIPLMMITSGVGIVIGAILGLVFGGLLNLYTGGSIIGIGSTLIWFIIAGAIIVWKINALRNR